MHIIERQVGDVASLCVLARREQRVNMPANITVLLLPPYSPELNPVENLWYYIRSHSLSNRAYEDYESLLDAGQTAWRSFTPAIIRSVCQCEYLTHEIQR